VAEGGCEVFWSHTAQEDLKEIIEYIATEDLPAAFRILEQIRAKAGDLVSLPERGRLVPELKDQGIGLYRELVVPPWRILYRITGRKVHVLAVIDSRRNVEDILLLRLLRE
jgi:plasmid stabilization system protein ParE